MVSLKFNFLYLPTFSQPHLPPVIPVLYALDTLKTERAARSRTRTRERWSYLHTIEFALDVFDRGDLTTRRNRWPGNGVMGCRGDSCWCSCWARRLLASRSFAGRFSVPSR